ncbi:MAG: YbjN domain-containing protein [Sphingobium sp.]|nr:YbjN domain-containing protein [Sphingobium sp.]
MRLGMVVLAAGLLAGAAQASDKEPCGKGMVCASAPQTVIDALQAAGYKAVLTKSENSGNPMIESAASGYKFNIFFYECEEKKSCGSLQFNIGFTKEDDNTPELANLWNRKMRFIQMSAEEDKTLNVNYDVTTVGGLNQKNFADVIDWWAFMLGEMNKFFKENPAKPAKK